MQGANADRFEHAHVRTLNDPPASVPGRDVSSEIGRLVAGRYRLVERIAVGGMGVVWEGWDELLARRVVVKQVLTQPGLSDADALLARNRVIREARITARLHHPHAVTIYDVVDDGDYPCLIIQFVPSTSLAALLRERGTLPPSQVGRIGADLASALHAAHEVGIVHRDVKPGNVLITDDGSAKLTDFGISHAAGDVTLTSTGLVSGTPAYLAPEVARGGTSGFPADVFSLGATMYASLEGTPPFGIDTNPMAVLHRVASGKMIPPQRSGPLAPLLLRMMAPEPGDRPTMSEVSATLAMPARGASTPLRTTPVEKPSTQTVPVSLTDLAAAQPNTADPRAIVGEPGIPAHARSSEPVDSHRPRRRMGAMIAVVVVVLAALTAGFLLRTGGEGGQGSVAATSAQGQPGVAAAQVAQSPSSSADSAQTGSGRSPASNEAQGPESTAASASDQAAELAAAVSDYYALMPGNTDAGWARLTPSFQSGIARDREYYNSFWGGIQRVVVSDAAGIGPDTAEATITYYFSDGRVSVERTEYRLVRNGGLLKIDNSSVLSSRAG